MSILLFLIALALLILGAEALVRGASRLAVRLGVPSLIIGLTVVAFGTSSPEFAVSMKAALDGQSGIALGNIVGSNIFNVLFILGLSALVAPLIVSVQLVRLDVPLMLGLSLLVLLLGLDGNFSRVEGLGLSLGLLGYIWFSVIQGRKEGAAEAGQSGLTERDGRGWLLNLGLVVGGLALLVLGSRWLLAGAIPLARYLGVSEQVIGLTLVSAGTSLPEVVTSVIASLRGERDIAVGNVVGSNLFNILGVLGLTSVVAPTGIEVSPAILGFDMPVMLGAAFACLPIFFTGRRISRWEGGLLLGYYLAYTLYLVLAAQHHDALPWFSGAMLYFVLPLTLLTLAILAIRQLRQLQAPS